MSLTLLTLGLLSAPPAQAQYPGGGSGGGYPGGGGWVACDAGGYPLSGGNGLVPLVPHDGTGDDHSTYPIPADADSFWFQAFSPNSHDSGDGSDGHYNPGLFLFSHADNFIQDMSRYGHGVGTYAPDPLDPSEWMAGQTQPPDLIGEVTADHKSSLKAYFT